MCGVVVVNNWCAYGSGRCPFLFPASVYNFQKRFNCSTCSKLAEENFAIKALALMGHTDDWLWARAVKPVDEFILDFPQNIRLQRFAWLEESSLSIKNRYGQTSLLRCWLLDATTRQHNTWKKSCHAQMQQNTIDKCMAKTRAKELQVTSHCPLTPPITLM